MKGTQFEREGIERRHRWGCEEGYRMGRGGGAITAMTWGTHFPEFRQFITCYTYNIISQVQPGTYSSETYKKNSNYYNNSYYYAGFFLASFDSIIKGVSMNGLKMTMHFKSQARFLDVDFHFLKGLLFWFDSEEGKIYK